MSCGSGTRVCCNRKNGLPAVLTSMDLIDAQLQENGYAVIPDVIGLDEIGEIEQRATATFSGDGIGFDEVFATYCFGVMREGWPALNSAST
jgi:hypothetical protein